MNLDRLIERIKEEEGFSPIAYFDNDQWSYGYGCKAPGKGASISREDAEVLLKSRINLAVEDTKHVFPAFDLFTEARQESLVDFLFNLGMTKVLKFIRMIGAIRKEDWLGASIAAENSLWFTQTGNRAKRICKELKTGETEKA